MNDSISSTVVLGGPCIPQSSRTSIHRISLRNVWCNEPAQAHQTIWQRFSFKFSINIHRFTFSHSESGLQQTAKYLPRRIVVDRLACGLCQAELNISTDEDKKKIADAHNWQEIEWIVSVAATLSSLLEMTHVFFHSHSSYIISFDLFSKSNWSILKCNSIEWVIHFLAFGFFLSWFYFCW